MENVTAPKGTINKYLFLKLLDLIGLLLISFCFYKFIPFVFPDTVLSYPSYLIFFTLVSMLITYIFNYCKFTYTISSLLYFIILIVAAFYL